MTTDVAEARGAEESVTYGMKQDIGIRVAEQTLIMGNVDAADDQLSSCNEAVYVVTSADSHNAFPVEINTKCKLKISKYKIEVSNLIISFSISITLHFTLCTLNFAIINFTTFFSKSLPQK
jgi:hypothetical protein